MANSKIPTVQLTDTFNTQRNRFNSLVDSVGDVSTLTTTSKEVTGAIKELDAELGTITAGAMGTTASTVSTAIGEIDGRLDSINTTQLLSPRMTLSDSSATNIIRGKLQIDGGITSLSASNLTLDSDLTVHGIANLDSTNVVGQLDVTGSITATNFTVSGAFTTAGATRNAASFVVTNDGATVTNTNRAGLAVDRPSLDSAVIQWNELGDFWEIGTNQTDGGSSSDLKRVARQNDSAIFSNLMQSGTGATRIPAGTTAQRPSSEQGQIRYNTTNASFEGYSGSAWSGLGGLIDVDGDTKVLAERSAGNDSDTLTFFTAGVERLRINDSGSTFATNISGAGLTLSANITMAGGRTVDGYDVSSLGSKLAGIETGATADQTASQIKTAYESNANTEAFTTALQSKLNGIANSANAYTLPTAAAGTKGGVKVGNGLSISNEVLSHTDTSSQASSNNSGRTYIQDITLDTYGHVTGLSTASESVVNTDTVYTHPSHPGDDMSVDTGALSGATVISDLDFNVTTDTLGHVTDANATVSTRNITLANLGYTGATNANNITNNNQLTNGAGYTTATGTLSAAPLATGVGSNTTSFNVDTAKMRLNTVTTAPVASANDTIAIGGGASATNTGNIAIGKNAITTNPESVTIGQDAKGWNTSGINSGSVAIGPYTQAAASCIAIGRTARNYSDNGTVGGESGNGQNSIAIGQSAYSYQNHAIAIGTGASSRENGTAVGGYAQAGDAASFYTGATAVGRQARALGASSVALGGYSSTAAAASYSLSLGYAAAGTLARRWIFGSDNTTSSPLDIIPGRNNNTNLGHSNWRFATIYYYTLSSGSDERLKQDIGVLNTAELRVANRLRVKKYRMKDDFKDAVTAIDEVRGIDSDGAPYTITEKRQAMPAETGKLRIGLIAQEVIAAFTAEGLDWQDYNMIKGTPDDDGDMLSVSYDDLEAFMLAATMQRLNDLEARIAALE
jgi:hypothetical protein